MISIPMLLTRRGWLGWATPYFLSLSVRPASLHAPRPRFSFSFWPSQALLSLPLSLSLSLSLLCERARHFIQLVSLPPFIASCNLSIVPSRRVSVCKTVLADRCRIFINEAPWLMERIVANVKYTFQVVWKIFDFLATPQTVLLQ